MLCKANISGQTRGTWNCFPFVLELLIPADEFHRKRAAMRMRAGYTPLQLVSDALAEAELEQAVERISGAKRAVCEGRVLLK